MALNNQDRIFTGNEYKDYMKSYARRENDRINYDDAMALGIYSPYSLAYNLGDIADTIGWDVFTDTFTYFFNLEYTEVPSSKLGKFNLFLTKLSEFSNQDVFAMFTNSELAIYEDYFGGEISKLVYNLGSPRHIESFTLRLNHIVPSNAPDDIRGSMAVSLLMADYYTFLDDKNVDYAGKVHDKYWMSSWDSHWDIYCNMINHYIFKIGSVDKETHYFRNNLNGAPATLGDLQNVSSEWDIMQPSKSQFHMYNDRGEYNLKFVSASDGKFEGVYEISESAYQNRVNPTTWDGWKSGLSLTELESKDAINMGTYNYVNPSNMAGHGIYDVAPWLLWDNIANEPSKGESHYQLVDVGTPSESYHNYVRGYTFRIIS